MDQSAQIDDLKMFRAKSFGLGSLALLPFAFILLMLFLNKTFGYYLHPFIFIGLFPLGVIGFVIIAFAEVKLIWRYWGEQVDHRKLTRICLLIFLAGFLLAVAFVRFNYSYAIMTYMQT